DRIKQPDEFYWGDDNYDYKKVEIQIEKNKKLLLDWNIMDNLQPVKGYKLNYIRYNDKNNKETVSPWKSTHQTGEITINYNDIIVISLRELESKKIIRKLFFKRPLHKPTNFIYYQAY